MRNDRHFAIKLRKQGKSYNKISGELKIPKSTLSDWLSDIKWSEDIKKELTRKANYIARKRLRLINKARKKMWEEWRKEARQQAVKEFPRLKKNFLFLAGLMLYWGEGDSKMENSVVRLSNTDPMMIKIFSYFLQKICLVTIEKIRLQMILYPDLNEGVCKKFWSEAAVIPESQFYKTQFIQGKHPTRRLTYGICIIRTGGRQLKEKIYTWIKLYQQELMRA
ncbi:hypothetical protein DRN69_07125 [Candidatus Pacearchaeota archaeon]|nr:MAG: hypothetical protein DRN69_07125 [Candidatus Pacearchaeota archaeon]